jgi:hypothetical protein
MRATHLGHSVAEVPEEVVDEGDVLRHDGQVQRRGPLLTLQPPA